MVLELKQCDSQMDKPITLVSLALHAKITYIAQPIGLWDEGDR